MQPHPLPYLLCPCLLLALPCVHILRLKFLTRVRACAREWMLGPRVY